MVDRGKVIKGLECCSKGDCADCDNCTYREMQTDVPCESTLMSDALTLLKAQEPRVMTLEELEHAEVAYAEDKDKTDIIPVLVLGKMCEHVALVKPHVDEEAITRMIIPRADEYSVRWRCWTSQPDDKRRAETPWESVK